MISKDEVKYLSELCKIGLGDQEAEDLSRKLSDILKYLDILKRIDTQGVEPTYHISTKVQPLREDIVGESLEAEEVLKNAPEDEYGYFKLLRVMD